MYYQLQNDVNIYYEVIGEGKPIIMLHGSHVDHMIMKGCLEPIFQNKNTQYKRIYFDIPGMGKTKAPKWLSTEIDLMKIIIEFINHILGETMSFLLIGESFGGYLARGMVKYLKKRIGGMVLICPMVSYYNKRLPQFQVFKKERYSDEPLSEADRNDFESIQVLQDKRNWIRFKEEILSGLQKADHEFFKRFDAIEKEDPFSMDYQIYDNPCLFLLGRQDQHVGYADALSIIEKYPRATYAVLDIAGHNLQIEQDKLFNALIEEWIERIELKK